MMGLFKRFNDIVSANLNDLIDRFEDPEKGLKQAIREMEESIQTATAETTKVLANQKRLDKEVARNASDVQKWNSLAEQSVDASDDDAARNALGKVAEYGTLLESLNQQLSSATGASDVLKEQLSGMRAKMEEAKRSLATLSACQKAAEIRKQAISSTNKMGDVVLEKSAFDKFDRLREKVEIAESEAEALAEITGGISNTSAPGPADIEAQLAALKANRSKD